MAKKEAIMIEQEKKKFHELWLRLSLQVWLKTLFLQMAT